METAVEQLVRPALYVVATPIGNLADMTQRAVTVLESVDLIAAEDTRHSGQLFRRYQISTPSISLHEHNESERIDQLLRRLAGGASIALVSDAGTPLISDPGYRLVSRVREAGYQVVPVPGTSAVITALCASGLPTDSFTFAGFIPTRSAQRESFFSRFVRVPQTLVFYESPKRLTESLQCVAQLFGPDRQVVIARELTKLHETFLSGSAASLVERLHDEPGQARGEIVLLVEGEKRSDIQTALELDEQNERWLRALLQELPVSRAAQLVAKVTGLPRRKLYNYALTLQ